MKTIAVIGATGYLGQHVCQSLTEQGYQVRYLVRSPSKLLEKGVSASAIRQVDPTQPDTLENELFNVDCVISCLGITKQQDGLNYMDVDFRANANVLDEALRAGVKKFIYVSVFRGQEFTQVRMCKAKERFVEYLSLSRIESCIVRPTGFFSDMKEYWSMAKQGRSFIFGKGLHKLNPIHGRDLADEIVNLIDKDIKELNIGGPQALSHQDISALAFESLQSKNRTIAIPDWCRRAMLWFGSQFLDEAKFGALEFFLTLSNVDMVAPKYGKHTLKQHFEALSQQR